MSENLDAKVEVMHMERLEYWLGKKGEIDVRETLQQMEVSEKEILERWRSTTIPAHIKSSWPWPVCAVSQLQ